MSGFHNCRFWMMVIFAIFSVPRDTETASLVKRWTKCETSFHTLKVVSSCPTSDKSYALRAQQMNCESYEYCDGEPCVYHCAMNPWGNATMEVCAPETFITDHYCPHFSTGVGRVLEHHGYPCQECPFNYLSTRGYKYKSCTKVMQKTEEKKTRLAFTQQQPLENNSVVGDTNSNHEKKTGIRKSIFTTMPPRSKHLFEKSDLSEDSHIRSGSEEIIITVSVLGFLALLILLILGTVSYMKGKLSTTSRCSEKKREKETNTKHKFSEEENCLHQEEIKDQKTFADNSEHSGLT